MRSKTSKCPKSPSFLWRDESDCSDASLAEIAREFASELRLGDRVFLEGPMGAGKTTFAKALLSGLGVELPAEGSPTFAIAHEYPWRTRSKNGEVIHLDLYRLKSEEELEDAGIHSYFWERDALVLVEWSSLFPAFQKAILENQTVWEVSLAFESEKVDAADRRRIRIRRLSAPAGSNRP